MLSVLVSTRPQDLGLNIGNAVTGDGHCKKELTDDCLGSAAKHIGNLENQVKNLHVAHHLAIVWYGIYELD